MNTKDLFEKMSSIDSDTQKKLINAKSAEEIYEISKSLGYEGTMDEFNAKNHEIHRALTNVSEEDLTDVTVSSMLEDAPEGPVGTLITPAALAAAC